MRIEVCYSKSSRNFFSTFTGIDRDSAAAIGLNTVNSWGTRRGAENLGRYCVDFWRKEAERKLTEAQESGRWTIATVLENFLLLSANVPVVHC